MGEGTKTGFLAVATTLLVAAVVGAVTFGLSGNGNLNNYPPSTRQVSTASKAVNSMCESTEYEETCQQTLAGARSDDPKELVKHAFNVTIANIGDIISKSKVIQQASEDPRTSEALEVCREVLSDAIFDFQRSTVKVASFDTKNIDTHLADVKTWLSATSADQQTCLYGFENATGDAGDKMKQLLKTTGELSSNGLAMVTEVAKIFATLKIQGINVNRRLMSDESINIAANSNRRLTQTGSDNSQPKPTVIVVSQDGSGQFKTIMEAVNTIAENNTHEPLIILIKAGIYEEYVELPKHYNNIVLVGEGPNKTRITGSKNFIDGSTTYRTATLSVNGDYCILRDLAIENSSGPEKQQGVALRVSGDMAIIHNCQLEGYQDTLYSHSYRQFYRDTTITGSIDFVFGDGQAVFQNCTMVVRKPMENQGCTVTAQGRKEGGGTSGFVLQNCTIAADPAFLETNPRPKAYLGRPWKEYSRTIIMQSFINEFIDPDGWSEWAGDFGLDTLYYGEYKNRGPGSDTGERVHWKGIHQITGEIAQSFTAGQYIQGESWVPKSGIPYEGAMMLV